jgi:hypothetical protein
LSEIAFPVVPQWLHGKRKPKLIPTYDQSYENICWQIIVLISSLYHS